ncbi:GNAT family N-acetyltransferase [Ferrimonas gelatinilytica]|uniref:GNAT family N-acetyltransferase n=1 Tax=Ferrimonas gelatinilytica TaxID=1255257 RepID=A0ABP9S5F9_9GAMM
MSSVTLPIENMIWKEFKDLGVEDLYALLQLRERVFQLEQESLYADLDGLDRHAQHLLLYCPEGLAGYLRLIPGAEVTKLGRVVLASEFRGQDLGAKLVRAGILRVWEQTPSASIKISAQQGLVEYYSQFGFAVCSEPYDDGGVMHLDMLLTPPSHP